MATGWARARTCRRILLDDGEAVAVAIGLQGAASQIAGIEETARRALAKLEQVMPARVRRRLKTVQDAVVALPRPAPTVDADTLGTIAAACRDNAQLRFDYRDYQGKASPRTAEPHRVVHDGRRFYLVAWDRDRDDWRTFRVDRMQLRLPLGARFVPRPPPEGDLLGHVTRGVAQAAWAYRATVKIHAPAAELARRLPPSIPLQPLDAQTCTAQVGSDSPEQLAAHLGRLGVDFEVLDAPELLPHLQTLGARYLRAATAAKKPRR